MSEAPRWRLINEHYLNVPELPDGTRVEWEHKETARETGRSVRKLFPVPMLLDPRSPSDCNYPGELIVAHTAIEGETNYHQDYLFRGDPTPDMEPLNDAAHTISNALRDKWEHPIESLAPNGAMSGAESAFMAKMMEAFAKIAPPQVPNTSVSREEYDALRKQLDEMKALLAPKAPAPATERRA